MGLLEEELESSAGQRDNKLEQFGRRRMQCPHRLDVGVVRCLASSQSGNF